MEYVRGDRILFTTGLSIVCDLRFSRLRNARKSGLCSWGIVLRNQKRTPSTAAGLAAIAACRTGPGVPEHAVRLPRLEPAEDRSSGASPVWRRMVQASRPPNAWRTGFATGSTRSESSEDFRTFATTSTRDTIASLAAKANLARRRARRWRSCACGFPGLLSNQLDPVRTWANYQELRAVRLSGAQETNAGARTGLRSPSRGRLWRRRAEPSQPAARLPRRVCDPVVIAS